MSRFFVMLRAKNYYIRAMFHGVIHKIKLAQFFLRHGVYTKLLAEAEQIGMYYKSGTG